VKDKYLYCFLLTIYPFESHSLCVINMNLNLMNSKPRL
jgi:hypothetical protein